MSTSDGGSRSLSPPEAERLALLRDLDARGVLDVDDADELGRLLFETGDLDASLSTFAAAVDGHPSESWLRHNYAEALLSAGRLEDAAVHYELAGVQAADVEDLGIAAELRFDLEDWVAVERVATAGLALHPDDLALLVLRANALDDLGQHDEAETAYRQATVVGPRDPDALFNFGLFMKRRGRHDEAIALLSMATEVDPDLRTAWVNLADVLELTGDGVRARRARERGTAIPRINDDDRP